MKRRTLILLPLLAAASVAAAAPPAPSRGKEAPRVFKKRIAVMAIEDKIVTGNHREFVSTIAGGMTEMLTTALRDTGQFVVVERAGINDILGEQDLAARGITTPQTGAKPGQVLGAQILVRGAITEFEMLSKDAFGGVRVGDVRLNLGRTKAHVGLDIRAYDPNTSEVLASDRYKGSSSSASTRFDIIGNHVDVFSDQFRRSALGRAMRDAVDDAVKDLVARLGSDPWQGRLIVDKDGRLYVNAGENMGLRPGDRFEVVRPGDALIDPETGLPLARRTQTVGMVEVTEVNEKFSAARLTDGKDPLTGDVVQELRPARTEGVSPRRG